MLLVVPIISKAIILILNGGPGVFRSSMYVGFEMQEGTLWMTSLMTSEMMQSIVQAIVLFFFWNVWNLLRKVT